MSIIIKGLDMPKDKQIGIVVYPDGTAYSSKMFAGVCTEYLTDGKAEQLPPHGRLIDADALCDGLVSNHPVVIHARSAPTIIPAEEGEE